MKKRNLLALMLGFGIFVQGLDVFSQNSTQCINYQAVVRDSTNRLVATKTIDILITLMDTSGTNEYYQEIHRTTTNTQGLVTLKIGCGTAIKGDFFSIRWDMSQMRAEYDIDTNGVYDLLSIETISAVPYALYSANAENLQNNFDSIVQNINMSIADISNHLTISGLCDSVSNCEIIRILQDSARMFLTSDSIQILVRDSIANFLTSDSIQRLVKDSLSNYLTLAGLCDSVSNCEIIRTLQDSVRMFLTSDSIQILVRDSIADFLTSDSIQRLVQDSLSNYLKLYELCSKIGECGIITELQNSVQDNASALIRDSINLKETIMFLDDTIRMLFDSLHALQDSLNQLKQNMINGEETILFVVGDDYEEYSLGNHNEPKTAAVIKAYVNGARICCAAWSYDQQNRSFVYDPAKNDNYELEIGDNIIIEYFY